MTKPLRVVDLTNGWAGPLGTCLLGDFGAEVIKVESPSHMDWWRGAGLQGTTDGAKPYEQSPTFNTVNRNKYGIALELTHPRGRALFRELVRVSDVLIANYPLRSLRKLGIDYQTLSAVNPRLVMVTLPAFGNNGPDSEYVGFGCTTEAMAGITGVSGYEDGPPQMLSNAIGDPGTALNTCFAALVGLFEQERRGAGVSIDLSHVEGLLPMNAEALLDYTINGRVQGQRGNRHSTMAPHGCYPCKGDDEWVMITVASDAEWEKFRCALGNPAWARAEKFATTAGRKASEDELDNYITAWTKEHDHYEVMELLQNAGVAAGAVLSGPEILSDAHLAAREFLLAIDKAEAGMHLYPGFIPRFHPGLSVLHLPPPCFGEHNAHVFGTILGLSAEEIEELAKERIISTEPIFPTLSR
ncbi:MAG: CoA transferase [Deltaproteobacteria bacterium]|nr:CoA transferase [Deltaproteobacteria bacterium]